MKESILNFLSTLGMIIIVISLLYLGYFLLSESEAILRIIYFLSCFVVFVRVIILFSSSSNEDEQDRKSNDKIGFVALLIVIGLSIRYYNEIVLMQY